MTYHEKDYQDYLKILVKFQKLPWVQNHLHLIEKPNFWTILEYGRGGQERSAYETRLSRMFRWLLDPNETHRLGNIFAKKVLDFNENYYKSEKYIFQHHKNEAIETIAEQATKGGKRLDLLFEDRSQQVIIAIEVKQYAKESKENGVSQLLSYEEYIYERIKDTNIRPYFIYLTPTGEKASRNNWTSLSYKTFIEFIDQVKEEYIKNSTTTFIEDTKKIIGDFKDDLQRSIDFASSQGYRNSVNELLSQKEKNLTQLLAIEIQHEKNTEHLTELKEINTFKELELEELIQILDSSIYVQDQTTNIGAQMLTRKIYNFFSKGEPLPTNPDEIKEYKPNEKLEPIKQSVIDTYDLSYEEITLTPRKGQGLYIHHKTYPYRVYMSGDSHGNFPNDGIQLIYQGDNEAIKKTEKFPVINDEKFRIDYHLILEDKMKTSGGKEITIDQFIKEFLILELKRLNSFMTM